MFRGGKLSFLNNKDDRIKIINDRVNLTEKHFIELYTTFSAYTRRMAKYRDSYDELGQKMKSYADDESINETLSEGMRNFTKAITIVGDYMDLQIHRMEAKIVSELSQFENSCKSTRDKLKNAVTVRDREVMKQRQMIEMKSKFSASNTPADAELLKAKLDVKRSNKEIDDIVNNFEKRKLTDLKTILTDFILIQLKYHTKTLEALSASYYDMTNINEKYDLMEFEKLMKINEEPTTAKPPIRKGLTASISMDSLHTLSPRKPKSRLLRSSNSAISKTDDEDDDDDDEDDDDEEDEEEEDSEISRVDDEENSGTISEDDASQTAATKELKVAKTKVKKVKSKMQIKQPFRAQALTNKLQSKSLTKIRKTPSSVGIQKPNKGAVIKKASSTLANRTSNKSLGNKPLSKSVSAKTLGNINSNKALLATSKNNVNVVKRTSSHQVTQMTVVKSKPVKIKTKPKRKTDKAIDLKSVKKLDGGGDGVGVHVKKVSMLKI